MFIDYTGKPNEFGAAGSEAITGAEGLYFINPLEKDTTKPIEIIAFIQVVGGFDKQSSNRINVQLKDLIEKKQKSRTVNNADRIDEQIALIQASLP
ncbi:MAG: hypothetical protein LH478_15880 [Chitinophagaceae bacterium]|nr:hypothetical protein [Chitinophagaceae bacterium]